MLFSRPRLYNYTPSTCPSESVYMFMLARFIPLLSTGSVTMSFWGLGLAMHGVYYGVVYC